MALPATAAPKIPGTPNDENKGENPGAKRRARKYPAIKPKSENKEETKPRWKPIRPKITAIAKKKKFEIENKLAALLTLIFFRG